MIRQLKMQNFRQHEDRTIEFTAGVNAIRGVPEAGKSSCLLAIAYALFGAKALPNTLDETVTYGAPVSKLRVELDFQHLGIDYSVYRAKSGAELNWAGGKVTGQDAVTAEIERLFDTDAKMAGKMMIASQKQLAGDFTEGSAGAARMIESLADFALLDIIKDLIQSELPSGNTTSMEGRIALLTEQAEEPELIDLAPLEKAVTDTDTACQAGAAELVLVQRKVVELEQKNPAGVLANLQAARERYGRANASLDGVQARLQEKAPEAPTDKQMQKLIDDHEKSKRATAALVLLCDLQAADTEMLWDEPRAALDAAITAGRAKLQTLIDEAKKLEDAHDSKRISGNNRTRDLEQAIQLAEMKVIKDSTCAFCQKDLTDVPEVVKINAASAAEVVALKQQLSDHREALAGDLADLKDKLDDVNGRLTEQGDECRALDEVVKVADRLAPLYAKAHEYIELDESVVPAQWKWTGPTSGSTDAAEKRFAAEKQRQALQEFNGRRAEAERALAAAQVEVDAAGDAVMALAGGEAQAEADLRALKEARAEVTAATDAQLGLSGASHAAQRALAAAQTQNETAQQRHEKAKVDLAAAHAELLEMQANNALVKKVAAARPVITDKLWGMVLGAASSYLTTMRGIASAITRADGRFLVNGKDASHLSGSAADCLGLALRVGLTRTFIPTAPFLILDEPAAACNDERESAMLGLLATLGFQQVILITHSDLCEAFADNLIRIE